MASPQLTTPLSGVPALGVDDPAQRPDRSRDVVDRHVAADRTDHLRAREQVGGQLAKFIDESGINYLAARVAFGDLTFEQSLHSLELLTDQVFPDLAELAPAVS